MVNLINRKGVPPEIVATLAKRGHQVKIAPEFMFGKGQMILRHTGVLVAASEPRADGLALGY